MLKKFQVNDRQISCWVNPDGFATTRKNLVFIHGAGSNSSVWAYQYAKLHRTFNIAAVNLPGHGESGGKGEPEIGLYARDVKEILDVLGLARPVIAGHSMGAAITLSIAAHLPESVSGIVLAGASATLPVNPDIIAGLADNPDAALDMIGKFSVDKENRPKLLDAVRVSLSSSGIDILSSDMQACNRVDLTADLAKISVPALVICGASDKMTSPEASKTLAAQIRGARLTMIEGAGHMVMMERPDEFNDAITNFCQEMN